jgi:hypothetical protein
MDFGGFDGLVWDQGKLYWKFTLFKIYGNILAPFKMAAKFTEKN